MIVTLILRSSSLSNKYIPDLAERCFGEGLVVSNNEAAGESPRVEGEVAVECAGERPEWPYQWL
jgi:hypothetical protein